MVFSSLHIPSTTEKWKELVFVFPSEKFTPEVKLIVDGLIGAAPTYGITPIETLVVSIGDKWRAVLMRVKGQTWSPVAKWQGSGRRLDSYTTLPDNLSHNDFHVLNKWCDTHVTETTKKVVYLNIRV